MYKATIPFLIVSLSTFCAIHATEIDPGGVILCPCPLGNLGDCLPQNPGQSCGVELTWTTGLETGDPYGVTLANRDRSLVLLANSPGCPPYTPCSSVVVSLDARNGEQEWQAILGPPSGYIISSGDNDDTVFVQTPYGAECDPYTDECTFLYPSEFHGYNVKTGEHVAVHDGSSCSAVDIVQSDGRLFEVGTSFYPVVSGLPMLTVSATRTEDGGQLWYFSDWDFYDWVFGASVATDESGTTVFAGGWNFSGTSPDHCTIYALDSATGSVLWSASVDDCRDPKLAISPMGDRVFMKAYGREGGVGDWIGTIVAHDALTGAELWRVRPSPAGVDSNDFVVSTDGRVVVVAGHATVALDASNGDVLWTDDSVVVRDIVAVDSTIVVTGETDDGLGFTAARRPATGITVWTATSQHVARSVMAGSRGGRVYTFGSTPDGVFLDAYSTQGK